MTTKRPRRRLSRRAEKVILALLEHSTQDKAAAAAGISPVTLWRLQRKPKFRRALLEARSEAFSQAIGRLQQGTSAAATTLFRIMCDPTAPAASRVRAAQCVLESAARGLGLQDLEIQHTDFYRRWATRLPLAGQAVGASVNSRNRNELSGEHS